MLTRSLLFRFNRNPKVDMLMDACRKILEYTVEYAIENKKTSTNTLVKNLYHIFKGWFPSLHSSWIQKSIRAGASVVHSYNNRKRKGKAKDKPEISRPFVYVSKSMMRWEWDGKLLTIVIPVFPHDPDPIVLRFIPHHRYRRYLDGLKEGHCSLGEPTLTNRSICFPLKFQEPEGYVPRSVIGIDSNERSLEWHKIDIGCSLVQGSELSSMLHAPSSFGIGGRIDTSYVAMVNSDCDKRMRDGCKGKRNPKARKKVQRKYGKKRREKTRSFWHMIAMELILLAMDYGSCIVLEDLKGMKGRISGLSRNMRRRLLNHWSIMSFHRIIKEKARFYGVPILFVDPSNTSRTCPVCGRRELRGHKTLECECGLSMGRDEVAAINIARRGMEILEGAWGREHRAWSMGQGAWSSLPLAPCSMLFQGRGWWALPVACFLTVPLKEVLLQREAQL
jgi:putative transposase